MARMSAELVGDKELRRALKELGKPSRVRTALRPALRKGAAIVSREAKSRAKQNARTGALWKSIGVKIETNRTKGTMTARILVRTDERYSKPVPGGGMAKPKYYAHLVEFGTEHSRPQPFLLPAARAKRGEARETVGREFGTSVEKVAARYRAKGKL